MIEIGHSRTLNHIAQAYPTLVVLVHYQIQNNFFCQTPVLGLGLGVDFTFAWDNNHNHNNPHLNFVKGTVLGDKEQGIRDKG